MYKFRDAIVGASAGQNLSSEALKINGNYIENIIPGYRTLSTSGREALAPIVDSFSVGTQNGSRIKNKRYPERVITVQYQIVTHSPEEFRAAYTKLAYILDVEDAELIFNDEPDKFFIGTPCGIGSVPTGRISVVGEFEILCADPFKYSVSEYEAIAQDIDATADDGTTYRGKAFVINYKGTYRAFPRLISEFRGDIENGVNNVALTRNGEAGFVGFFNDRGKVIQLGTDDNLDNEAEPKSQILINQTFQNSTSWGAAAREAWLVNNAMPMYHNEAQVGSIGTVPSMPNAPEGRYFLTATNFGSTSAERYGASITRKIPADDGGEVGAASFELSMAHKHCPSSGVAGKNECGVFYALVVSGSGSNRKVLAGFRLAKYAIGNHDGKLDFYVNGKQVESKPVPFTHENAYWGITGKQSSTISKNGNEVNFNVCGINFSFNCYDDGFAEEKATELSFMFARYGTANPLAYNGLTYVKFVKNNAKSWSDIPNKFGAGDVVEADCKTGYVYKNNLFEPKLGAVGNDWEEFYLINGINQIGASYSSWVASGYEPIFKLRYREVFL